MSILPLLVNLADELTSLERRNGWYDDLLGAEYFGRGSPSLCFKPRYCPYGPFALTKRSGGASKSKKKDQDLSVGKDGFQVCMDVQQFKPSELTVKTVDNSIVVEGKHEEREDDHGYISRHFVRRYVLPKGYDPKDVVSTLSSDGILTVKAPPPPSKALKNKERVIQIQQTGPAHLNIKDNSNENQNEDKNKMET